MVSFRDAKVHISKESALAKSRLTDDVFLIVPDTLHEDLPVAPAIWSLDEQVVDYERQIKVQSPNDHINMIFANCPKDSIIFVIAADKLPRGCRSLKLAMLYYPLTDPED